MKDSGIEWIGEIPEEWDNPKFKYLFVETNSGEVIDRGYWDKGEELLYSCSKEPILSDFEGFPNEKRTTIGDILLTRNATPYIFIPELNSIYTNVVQRVKIKQNICLPFVVYSLKSGAESLDSFGDIIPSFNMEIWKNTYCPMPSFPTQQQIATFLDQKCSEIDHILDKTRESMEEYKKLKQSIITEAVTKGLDRNVEMKESGVEWIGEIPKHWEFKRLKDIGHCFGGITYTPSDICDENDGRLVLRSSNVQNGELDFSDNVYVKTKIADKFIVKEGDILVCSRNGSRNLIGKNALVKNNMDYTFGAFMTIVRTQYYRFVHHFLNSNIFNAQSSLFLTSTVNQLTIGVFNNMYLALPNEKEQQQISDYLDQKCSEIDSLITQKQTLLTDLEAYKKSLIFECVTGKREVGY